MHENYNQQAVSNDSGVNQLCDSAMEGYAGTVFAYG